MSNYYCQFSTTLTPDKTYQLEWWRKYISLVKPVANKIGEDHQLLRDLRAECERTDVDCPLDDLLDHFDIIDDTVYQEMEGPDYSLNEEDTEILFYCEENCDSFEHLVSLVYIYLCLFEVKQPWSLTWAETCSSMEADAFGGGAVVVARNGIEYIDMHGWLHETLENLTG